MENFTFFVPITKVNKENRTVSGFCSTPALDLDGEIVSLDAIRKAAPGYWEYRNIRRMHSSDAVGVGKELNINEKGAFLTAKIVDEDAWKKCLEGVYKGFSIGGKKLAKNGNTITEIDWIETSIVDRPANPECKFDVAKKAKDGDGAFLVKLAKTERVVPKNLSKALTSLSKVAEFLTKDGVPAAHDGFSLPAKVAKAATCSTHDKADCPDCKCAAHGTMDCAVCKEATAGAGASKKPTIDPNDDIANDSGAREDTIKRKVKSKERKSLASQGKALPDGSFPIKNKGDLANARQAIGRSKNPGAARALIRRRARELGVTLPDNWSKKLAKSLIAQAEIEKLALGSATSSFLTLSAGGGDFPIKGTEGLGHGSPLLARVGASGEGDATFQKLFTKSERKLLKGMGIAGQLSYCFDTVRSAQRSLLMEAQREGGDMKDKALAEKLGTLAQGLAAVIGQKAEHEGAEALDLSDADDQSFLNLIGGPDMTSVAKGGNGAVTFNTEGINDPIVKGLLETLNKASVPSRATRMGMARGDLKKARGAAKDLEACIKAAHSMHKSAYLAKAAKKPKDDGDADDFDHQGAMEKLQKAYGDLTTLKTMMKSASGQLKKAMSRSGQRGQEVSDGNSDYEVPSGIKDLSPNDVDTAGGTSPPFIHGMETPFPGKNAKALLAKFVKNGQIPVEVAELLAQNASLESQVEVLGKLPGTPVFGKKPALTDMTKIIGGTKDEATAIMKGVDPADLTRDEASNSKAISLMLGNMITGGHGKSVFDNNFRGTGGMG